MSEEKTKQNKQMLEILSILMILFLNPANVRTAIFRVKPDSHFLDGAAEIDALPPLGGGVNKKSGKTAKFTLRGTLFHFLIPRFWFCRNQPLLVVDLTDNLSVT